MPLTFTNRLGQAYPVQNTVLGPAVAPCDPGYLTFTVFGTETWQDTGMDFEAGETLEIRATGLWAPVDPSLGTPGQYLNVGPDGYPDASQPQSGDQFLNLADIGGGPAAGTLGPNWGALVGYIGDPLLKGSGAGFDGPPTPGDYATGGTDIENQAARVFLIGSSYSATVPGAGRLYLVCNDNAYTGNFGDNSGQITVCVQGPQVTARCGDSFVGYTFQPLAAPTINARVRVWSSSGTDKGRIYIPGSRMLPWYTMCFDSAKALYVPVSYRPMIGGTVARSAVVKVTPAVGVYRSGDPVLFHTAPSHLTTDTIVYWITSVTADSAGNLYILEIAEDTTPGTGTATVIKKNPSGTTLAMYTLPIPGGEVANQVSYGAVDPTGTRYLYYFDTTPTLIHAYDLVGLAALADFAIMPAAAENALPYSLRDVGPVLVANWYGTGGSSLVREYTSDGSSYAEIGTPGTSHYALDVDGGPGPNRATATVLEDGSPVRLKLYRLNLTSDTAALLATSTFDVDNNFFNPIAVLCGMEVLAHRVGFTTVIS